MNVARVSASQSRPRASVADVQVQEAGEEEPRSNVAHALSLRFLSNALLPFFALAPRAPRDTRCEEGDRRFAAAAARAPHGVVAEADAPQGHRPRRQRVSTFHLRLILALSISLLSSSVTGARHFRFA